MQLFWQQTIDKSPVPPIDFLCEKVYFYDIINFREIKSLDMTR